MVDISDRNDRTNQSERYRDGGDRRGRRGGADHRGGGVDHRGGGAGERHFPENGFTRENGQYDSEAPSANSRRRGGGPGQGENRFVKYYLLNTQSWVQKIQIR